MFGFVSASVVLLSNGVEMPRVGLGTAARLGTETVALALAAGVKLVDTARATEWYDEDAVARAVARFNRSDVFVVTKLHPRDHGTESCRRAIADSAAKFGGYVDLFLLHYEKCWPGFCTQTGTWQESWRVMEASSSVRSIGVSNFADLTELLAFARAGPHVVQNWMDPFHQDRATRALCKDRGIVYMSYSTLGTQWGLNPVKESPVLRRIARAHDATVYAVTLAWALSRDAIVIPRASKPDHIRSNANLDLALSNAELEEIDALDGTAHQRRAVFRTDRPADLYWVDDHGKHVKVATLDPARDTSIDTYHGHSFIARSIADPDETSFFTVGDALTFQHGAEL